MHYSSSTLQQNRRKSTAAEGSEGGSKSDARYVSAPRAADLAPPSNPGFEAHLRRRGVIRGDAEAGLRGRLEDPGELAATFPDMLADDTSDKNVIRPASIIPAAGLELLRGQPEIQRARKPLATDLRNLLTQAVFFSIAVVTA